MTGKKIHTSNKSGMAAVEMAFILPLFFVLMLGMFDIGRWCWVRNVVNDAASQGARAAMLHEYTEADIWSVVESEVQGGGINSSPEVVVSERIPEEPVSVTVSVPFEFYTLASVLEGLAENRTITATAVVRHER